MLRKKRAKKFYNAKPKCWNISKKQLWRKIKIIDLMNLRGKNKVVWYSKRHFDRTRQLLRDLALVSILTEIKRVSHLNDTRYDPTSSPDRMTSVELTPSHLTSGCAISSHAVRAAAVCAHWSFDEVIIMWRSESPVDKIVCSLFDDVRRLL